jgi:poly(3-hydroxybutyrate) depolymerase
MALCLAASVAACGGGSSASDAGAADAPGLDASSADAAAIDADTADAGADVGASDAGPISYTTEMRTLSSGGVDWPYVLVRPAVTTGLPLVIGLHPDGGSGPGFHAQMMFESVATRPMIYAYPSAPGGQFEYYTLAGRQAAAQMVLDLIASLAAELGADATHVYVAGYSGGATMGNAMQCHLPAGTLRGVGLYAGTLYAQDDPPGSGMNLDLTYTAGGGVSCALAPVLFVWGTLDTSDVSFTAGEATRDNYRANFGCGGGAESAWTHDPCVTYAGCSAPVVWCPIAGFMHAPPWPGAGAVMQAFFETL